MYYIVIKIMLFDQAQEDLKVIDVSHFVLLLLLFFGGGT